MRFSLILHMVHFSNITMCDIYRLEVQADVTSTQRFSLCSETASAATSLSEKSVNASIALDDGAASTRALAGSVLNFKVFISF